MTLGQLIIVIILTYAPPIFSSFQSSANYSTTKRPLNANCILKVRKKSSKSVPIVR